MISEELRAQKVQQNLSRIMARENSATFLADEAQVDVPSLQKAESLVSENNNNNISDQSADLKGDSPSSSRKSFKATESNEMMLRAAAANKPNGVGGSGDSDGHDEQHTVIECSGADKLESQAGTDQSVAAAEAAGATQAAGKQQVSETTPLDKNSPPPSNQNSNNNSTDQTSASSSASSFAKSPSIELNRKLIHPLNLNSNTSNKTREEEEVIIGNSELYCKRKRLNYVQSLLLRKWPCLPLTIFIMASLLFGILLSVLTVYLMHSLNECPPIALAFKSPLDPVSAHDSLRRPSDFDLISPVETISIGSALSGGSQLSGKMSDAQQNETLRLAAQQQQKFRRLPSSLWPIHYDLFIQPFILDPFYFAGKVSRSIWNPNMG